MAENIDVSRETVSQLGTVRSIRSGYAEVAIAASSACGACAVRGSCLEGNESSGRTIRIPLSQDFHPGDRVRITLQSRHGLLAVVLMFLVPLVLLVGTVFMAVQRGWSEAMGALAGLGALGVYGFLVWLLNDRIQQKLPVEVVKITGWHPECVQD